MKEHGPNAFESASSKIGPKGSIFRRRQALGRHAVEARLAREEQRQTSHTGGQKGQKPERMDLIPPGALLEVARQYAWGAQKYSDWNWLKGYSYSLALAAMLRHIMAWEKGEDRDPESGTHHLAAVACHAFTLMTYQADPERYEEFDDRFCKQQEQGESNGM